MVIWRGCLIIKGEEENEENKSSCVDHDVGAFYGDDAAGAVDFRGGGVKGCKYHHTCCLHGSKHRGRGAVYPL